jgi:hypothetical protein
MRFAFAIEDVSRFSAAFVLTSCICAAVGASLVASDNLLFGRNDTFFLSFCHFQVSLVHFEATADRTYIHLARSWQS